jgi:hypothetical protein
MTIFQTQDCCRCCSRWAVKCLVYVSIRVSHWLYPILVYVSHIKVHHYDGTRLLFQGCHLGNQYIDNARIGQGRSVAELVRFVADNLAQNAAHNLARSRHG